MLKAFWTRLERLRLAMRQLKPGSHFRPDGEGLVYAPHRYDSTLLFGTGWSGIDPSPALRSAATFGADNGLPVLLGEFGYTDGAEGGPEWLGLVMDVIDDRRMSATLWEYSTSAEFTERERAALELCERMTRDDLEVSDACFARLRQHFSETEALDVVAVVGYQIFASKLAKALALRPQGFTAAAPEVV